jgi:thiol-disulfide isomerase/thioredoxin
VGATVVVAPASSRPPVAAAALHRVAHRSADDEVTRKTKGRTEMKHPLTTLLLAAVLLAPGPAGAYEIGDIVQDFTLIDLDGNAVSLHDHLGEIIVLNFFATWCPGCNEEAEALENQIWQVYRDRGVTVIAIDMQEPAELVQAWALAMGVTYHIWLAADWTVFQQFPGAGGLPYNAVLDRFMELRYAQLGFDLPDIVGMIETVLDDDAVTSESRTWSQVKSTFR